MRSLDRKRVRDLLRMRAQVVTIALVVACGIASYLTIEGTHRSLLAARDTYYERYRFPDLFVRATRAPESLLARILAVPGVALAYPRVVDQVGFPMLGLGTPATGYLVSYPSRSVVVHPSERLVDGARVQSR